MLRIPDRVAPIPPGSARSTPAAPLVSVRAIGYRAGALAIIDDVSFQLDATACTAVMGYNGAGKSVLLRLLHGLIEPTYGTITWDSADAEDRGAVFQAMVFQNPTLLRRSVADNLRYVMAVRGVARAVREERVHGLLADAEITHLANRSARVLSGGERQRVAILQAICGVPRVLFLDEPTASLDPASIVIVERLVRRARERGTKIILVTQDVGQGQRLADEVLFLHHGRLHEHTPADRFFDRPDSDVARAFLDHRLFL